MLTVGSLFAGIGGIDLGLERAGMQVRWQVENDPYCNRVLEKHWPNIKRYGDVKEVKWAEVESVDLICGGFPCQPVSVAGSRQGEKDERWLWPDFLRAICEVRPEYALVENVLGLLSIDDRRLARRMHEELAEASYNSRRCCISAQDVGAPQKRERIFIVAYSKDSGITRGIRFSANGSIVGQEWNPRRRRSNSVDWSKALANPSSAGLYSKNLCQKRQTARQTPWDSEPDVGRVVNGVSSRMDKNRIKCLGNAVVPQVAEYIGRLIVEYEKGES